VKHKTVKHKTIEVHVSNGVAALWLNRPEVRNALDATMVAELTQALHTANDDRSIRAVVLAGRGPAFCAGGDLAASRRLGSGPANANERDAKALSALFHRLYSMEKPTLARIHGAAYAGGLGLIAACDIAVAAQDAEFCLSEVKVGMAAASILPYLLRAMGERHTRRFVLSAEVFSAADAYRIGLVHELAVPHELDDVVDSLLGRLVKGGPAAQSTAKRLIDEFAGRPLTPAVVSATAAHYAALRASEEGREGIAAFLEKREPGWRDAKTKSSPRRKSAR
jgi:methylglutaconyl-CoA hydratase